MHWRLHWLEAEGDLGPWRDAITADIEAARQAAAAVVTLPNLDILVQRLPATTIPQTGDGGYAYRKGLFALSVDPDNPNFVATLSGGSIRRTVVHELHHCLRMAGPGYGTTLGEALVTEGLAGQFVRRCFGTPPEFWECAVDDACLRANRPDAAALADSDYDHAAWFFGSGACQYALGYTLGYRIVGAWLASCGTIDADTWINVPAATVLSEAGDFVHLMDPTPTMAKVHDD